MISSAAVDALALLTRRVSSSTSSWARCSSSSRSSSTTCLGVAELLHEGHHLLGELTEELALRHDVAGCAQREGGLWAVHQVYSARLASMTMIDHRVGLAPEVVPELVIGLRRGRAPLELFTDLFRKRL